MSLIPKIREDFHRAEAAVGYANLGMFGDALAELETLSPGMLSDPGVLEFKLRLLERANRWQDAAALAARLASSHPDEARWFLGPLKSPGAPFSTPGRAKNGAKQMGAFCRKNQQGAGRAARPPWNGDLALGLSKKLTQMVLKLSPEFPVLIAPELASDRFIANPALASLQAREVS